jgi:osmoprotectant transport system substrate-binding protein
MEPVDRPHRLVVSLIVLALVVTGCGNGDGDARSADDEAVTVAAFGFTESQVLAELYAQAMQAKGIPVRRAFDLASREVVEPALEQGVVDFVAEYSGTALEFVNRGAGQATADPERTYRFLSEVLAQRGVTALERAPAQNQNALAVTRATADRLNLTKVSDLRPVAPGLVFGGPPECPERQFCLPGLTNTYGITFRQFRPLDASGPRTVGALEGAEIDVGLVFTTSPFVAAKNFVLLADDRQLQPAENVVPVVRTSILEQYGDALRQAVDAVSARLTPEELVGLNRGVDIEARTPADVARAWLSRNGLDK